jgi:CRISPR-associated endoribonuclease Cas6
VSIEMDISVKFRLKNNRLPLEYRKSIISFYKNILSNYKDGKWKDKFYKNQDPIQKKFKTKNIHEIKPWMIDELDIKFNNNEVKKIIVTHYGIKFPVTIGCFYLKGNPVLLNFLHCSGMGSRTSSGFGHFKVI